jgi:hypothetical protein
MLISVSGYSGSGKDLVGTIIQYLVANNQTGYNNSDTTLNEIIKSQQEHDWWLEEQSGWEIKKWAGKLKEIASMLTGIPKHKFEDQEFKKTNLPEEWNEIQSTVRYTQKGSYITEQFIPMTVRNFLQKLGTDGLRDGLHENVWVNALMSDYVIIDDNLLEGEVRKVREEDLIYPNWIITDTRFPNEAEAIRKKHGILIRVERPGVKPINNHPSEVSLDKYNFDHTIINNGSVEELAEKVKHILQFHKII